MTKPETEKEILDQIWIMLAGINDDGMYFQLAGLIKKVGEFISNNENLRGMTCPYKAIIEKFNDHLSDHKGKGEVNLKKYQAILGGTAIVVSITIGVLGLVLK